MRNKYFVLVYHVNTHKNISNVVDSYKNGSVELYTSVEDGYWAGNGMYFWDNKGNANYWKKSRHNDYILKADLKIDENYILDFTDLDVVRHFETIWPLIAKKFHINGDATTPGKRINLICKFFDTVKVVKINGYYPNMPESYFISGGRDGSSIPHMTVKAKTIFCVKDADLLDNIKEIDY